MNLKTKEIDVERFKNMIFEMYKGFPNMYYSESEIKNVIVGWDVRKTLIKEGYFIEDTYWDTQKKKHVCYTLGPNALVLVSSWINEKIARQIKYLNLILISLTFALIILSIIAIT